MCVFPHVGTQVCWAWKKEMAPARADEKDSSHCRSRLFLHSQPGKEKSQPAREEIISAQFWAALTGRQGVAVRASGRHDWCPLAAQRLGATPSNEKGQGGPHCARNVQQIPTSPSHGLWTLGRTRYCERERSIPSNVDMLPSTTGGCECATLTHAGDEFSPKADKIRLRRPW